MKKENLLKVIAGLEVVLEVLREEVGQVPNPNADVETPKAEKRGATMSTPTKAEEKAPEKAVVKEEVKEEANTDRKAELEAMSFNDLKAYAKSIGVKAVGTKATILANVLATEVEAPAEEEEYTESHENEEVETAKEVDKSVADADGVNEEDQEAGGEEETTLYDRVVGELEGTSDEELADILSEIGISPKGKRQALLTKIVQAIEEGKLEFDTEEGGEEATEEDTTPADENNEADEDVTPERAEAMEEVEASLRKEYADKSLTDKEIAEFLDAYYNGDYKGTKKENVENYIAIQVALVDDEGEQHDFKDPYFIGEKVLCCGAEVKELDNGNMFCEVCGTEYENGEE